MDNPRLDKNPKVRFVWINHKNAITSYFERLFNEGINFDCTFAAEGEFIRGHQSVFSACSPYLEKLLAIDSEKNKHPVVILNCSFKDLEHIVQFVYRGEVQVSENENEISSLLQVAERLQIRGLERSSCNTIRATTDSNNVQTSSLSSPSVSNIENNKRQNLIKVFQSPIPSLSPLPPLPPLPLRLLPPPPPPQPPPTPSPSPSSIIYQRSLLPTSRILSQNDVNFNLESKNSFIPKIFTPSLSNNNLNLNLINNNNLSPLSSVQPRPNYISFQGLSVVGVGAEKRKSSISLHSPNIIRKRGRPRKVSESSIENNAINNFVPASSTQKSAIASINENIENNTNNIVNKAAEITLNGPCMPEITESVSVITISDDSEPETEIVYATKSVPQLLDTLPNVHDKNEENITIKEEPGALNNDEKKFQCDSCEKIYKYSNWLKWHIKKCPLEKCYPKYNCNICSKKIRQFENLIKHQGKCKGKRKKKKISPPPTQALHHNENETSTSVINATLDESLVLVQSIDELINGDATDAADLLN